MSDLLTRLRGHAGDQRCNETEAAHEIIRAREERDVLIDWIGRLEEYVDGQPCECHDEYGTRRPHQCDRCRLLLGKEDQADE